MPSNKPETFGAGSMDMIMLRTMSTAMMAVMMRAMRWLRL